MGDFCWKVFISFGLNGKVKLPLGTLMGKISNLFTLLIPLNWFNTETKTKINNVSREGKSGPTPIRCSKRPCSKIIQTNEDFKKRGN